MIVVRNVSLNLGFLDEERKIIARQLVVFHLVLYECLSTEYETFSLLLSSVQTDTTCCPLPNFSVHQKSAREFDQLFANLKR